LKEYAASSEIVLAAWDAMLIELLQTSMNLHMGKSSEDRAYLKRSRLIYESKISTIPPTPAPP